MTVENTLAAFRRALDLGVTTLELDVHITEDGHAVVSHDRDPDPRKCVDTAPAFVGDPEFPYVLGTRYLKDLTLAQVRTIDCGTRRFVEYPDQRTAPGAKMPLLSEVFTLVRQRRPEVITLNIELKVHAEAPEQTAPREQYVRVVAREVRSAKMLDRVAIASFDWGVLMRMQQVEPDLPIVALTNGQKYLHAGRPGASPWLGGIDIDDYGGDVVEAAKSFDADVLSPIHGFPRRGSVRDIGYKAFTTPRMVAAAHAAGLRVVAWTVNDIATMKSLIDAGVDGLITDYPDRLMRLLMTPRQSGCPGASPACLKSAINNQQSTKDEPMMPGVVVVVTLVTLVLGLLAAAIRGRVVISKPRAHVRNAADAGGRTSSRDEQPEERSVRHT